jgi:alpha-L-rhamnosidase
MALAFGLVPEKLKDKTLAALVHDISVTRNGHLWTGIIGTRYILDVLTDNGYEDLAFSLIECTTYPSWGYWFRNGATSLYETWELDTRSRNHHMFGSVDSWFYEYLCGMRPVSPGFASVKIKPYFPRQLSEASASYYTGFGELSVSWVRAEEQIHLSIVIPPGTDAIFCNTREPGDEFKLNPGLNKFTI